MNPINLKDFWLPRAGSTLAPDVDFAWSYITWVCAFFFVLVIGLLVYFTMKYKRRSENDKTSPVDHNLAIEVIWTVIPTVLVVSFFFVGWKGYLNAAVSPAESYEIRVIAKKWAWTFVYPNGYASPGELRVPVGRPVKLVLSSQDVLHSLFIPEFRVKQDAVPGTYTTMWFEATEPTKTVIECTEYCGTSHSDMLANVEAMEGGAFDEWLDKVGNEGKDLKPEDYGKQLFAKNACETCHSTDGSPKVGPSFKGLFGRQESLADGAMVKVDEAYVRESILNPTAKVVKGFAPVMPAFQGVLKDQQIDALIAFMKTVK